MWLNLSHCSTAKHLGEHTLSCPGGLFCVPTRTPSAYLHPASPPGLDPKCPSAFHPSLKCTWLAFPFMARVWGMKWAATCQKHVVGQVGHIVLASCSPQLSYPLSVVVSGAAYACNCVQIRLPSVWSGGRGLDVTPAPAPAAWMPAASCRHFLVGIRPARRVQK